MSLTSSFKLGYKDALFLQFQVKLKPRPWLERWERQELKGVSNIEEYLKEKDLVRRQLRATPWEKYDLMKEYRYAISICNFPSWN